MRLLLIRHADPSPGEDALTPAGHQEARALAQTLARTGLDRIYCSPLQRAIQTMEPAAKLLNREPVMEHWLTELDWYLCWKQDQKRSAWNLPGEIIRGESSYPLPSEIVQGFADFKDISDRWLGELGYQRVGSRYRVIQPRQEKIALFAHGGIGLTWLAHLLDIPLTLFWSGFWLDPCSVTTIHFEQHSKDWAVPRCLGLNDTSHLCEAGLKPQGSSILKKFAS